MENNDHSQVAEELPRVKGRKAGLELTATTVGGNLSKVTLFSVDTYCDMQVLYDVNPPFGPVLDARQRVSV